ncbi:MAG: hypothetical protein WCC60_16945, partial [Ilumatobacteraceae bacterium]
MSSESEQRPADEGPGQPSLDDLSTLIEFAADVTEALRLDDGVHCYDRQWAKGSLRGRSPRYTLMVALGFSRAQAAGYSVPRPAVDHVDAVLKDPAQLTHGDRGLAVWVLSRLGDERAIPMLAELAELRDEQLVPLEGMEISWLVIGCAAAVEAGFDAAALLERFLAVLRGRQARRGPLFHHLGTGRGRALLPNFATQVYSLL